MSVASKRFASQALSGSVVLLIGTWFFLRIGACDPLLRSGSQSLAKDFSKGPLGGPKPPATVRRKAPPVDDAEPYRAPGAYYPGQELDTSSGPSGSGPLLIAVIGGVLIFGLTGGGAFFVLNQLGRKEDIEIPIEESEPEL